MRYVFLTGTRADFGKLKPLIQAIVGLDQHDIAIFATGMHLQTEYGLTINEVDRLLVNTYRFVNYSKGDSVEQIVAKTINGLSDYLAAFPADFLIVHGDRPEALAAAIVGAYTNTRIIHIEGGEVSGTVDEGVRHAITKLSHIHLVSNAASQARILKLGEDPQSIFPIGSPEQDVMREESLPNLQEVLDHYHIPNRDFCLVLFHPVAAEPPEVLSSAIEILTDEILSKTNLEIVAIRPNNDLGSNVIAASLEKFSEISKFHFFPSIRFEYFLTLLKHARFIAGNSSSGVREAPFFGTPSINFGSRQQGRSDALSIIEVPDFSEITISESLQIAVLQERIPSKLFGDGKSAERFRALVEINQFSKIPIQKTFYDAV